jgi:uncharacterized C2H2 Zn-finger protein
VFFAELDLVIRGKIYKNGLGQWACSECGKTSTWKSDLTRHVEARHVVTDGVGCAQCHKIFKTRDSLRKHVKGAHQDAVVKV